MQSRRMLAIVIVVFSLAGCEGEADKLSLPIADFSFEFRGDCSTPVLEVLFENRSQSGESFMWDFGDGTTSNGLDPIKVYAKAGSYTVTLTAMADGLTDQFQQEITIGRNSDGTGPKVLVSYQRTDLTTLGVKFEIDTDGHDYTLSFGDGQMIVSDDREVIHTYSGSGNYTAFVVAENDDGMNCASIPVQLNP